MIGMYIDDIIRTAIKEDINYIDVSSDYLLADDHCSTAEFLAKDEGVLCGMQVALRVFELLGGVKAEVFKKDGDPIQKGEVLARISGQTKLILKGERTALNLIQHMSGIASATARAVRLVQGTNAQITDTRKTLPGMRALQKYAVHCGGGKNHRFNLSDAAMLKDNHIDAYGSIAGAVAALREHIGHTVKIEVETRNLDEVQQALDAGADIIMLDNMDNATMAEAVKLAGGKALLEASGGITEQTLRAVAETGVDIISIGALTHSVKAFDISLKIKKSC